MGRRVRCKNGIALLDIGLIHGRAFHDSGVVIIVEMETFGNNLDLKGHLVVVAYDIDLLTGHQCEGKGSVLHEVQTRYDRSLSLGADIGRELGRSDSDDDRRIYLQWSLNDACNTGSSWHSR